ncbi:E3 SUMO-protein ligase ZBED1-like [Anthonomus grandis grandis]|uniref:E3 SUMO-protein ligase ZBED1-like n=1 Tax=Anthonomus grandis grandis TaxID=2921223 RepID=UPI002166B1C7|nr:E3 SUMO-protein ligase ZBED1-like [Anthonomus grandis grandis]
MIYQVHCVGNFKKQDKSVAICSICKNKLKFYGGTTNLKKHLTRLHPIQYKQLTDNSEASTSNCEPPEHFAENREENGEDSTNINIDASEQEIKEIKVREKKRAFGENSEPSQPQPKEKLLKMMVLDFQPLSFVENKGIKDFANSINALYKIPIKSNIKAMLCEVNYVSVTTDIWTSDSNIAYVSLTCHFSYKDKLNSQVLSTDEISGSHTGENIGHTLKKILNEWGIIDKVVTIVSDNGSNIKNAVNVHLKKHNHPCVAHTLNLCVTDSIKENEDFSLICSKSRTLVSYFKHSVLATEKLKTTQVQMGFPVLKIKQDVATRWNSTLFMLERLLEIKDALSVTLSSLPQAPLSLNAMEWSIVWDCVPVLKPIEIMTSVLSAEKYPTISTIISLIRGLQHTLQHINPTTEVGIKLKQSLLEVIGRRLAPLKRDKIVAKATFLDPRFKGIGFGLEENAKNAESWVLEEVK